MNEQLLTIFTPTYNRGYILPKLYESLCTQEEDGYRFEWLIIDDASTDNTKEILEKLQEDYKFINLLDWKTCKDLIDNVNEK